MDYDTELANLEYDGISPEDVEAAKNGNLEPAKFPFIVFSVAVTMDIINIVDVGTASTLINILFTPILYVYLRKEVRHMKSLKKWVGKRAAAVLGGELIPVVNVIPWWSFFVYKVYKKRCQQTEKIQNFIESFAK